MMWQERKITVRNRCGVHGRVAARLAEMARQRGIALQIEGASGPVDCASILEVLSMALVCGSEVTVRARGRGADTVLNAVQDLLSRQDDP